MTIDPDRMQHYQECMREDYIIQHRKKCGKKYVADDILCFDIEVCNYYVSPEGDVCSIKDIFKRCNYNLDKIEAAFDTYHAGGLPYIWMFGYNGRVIYGRELSEFKTFLEYLSGIFTDETHIFVHNLAYEYTWLRELLDFDDVFLTDARTPLYANISNFTFRCSYRLTNLSLAKWGELSGVPKKSGDLDYYELYTPYTDIESDPLIMGYCKADIDVMYAGLKIYLAEYKHIVKIPLTQTGIVRRDVKGINQKAKLNYWVAECQPKTPEEWKVQHCSYNGGLTLVNPQHCGRILSGIESYDKKSAYPFALLQKYPNSAFVKTNTPVNWYDGNHHICLVEFLGFEARYNITPQSNSKHILIEGAQYNTDAVLKNNGKIRYADRCAFYITERDYHMLVMYYKWEKIIIHSHWFATSDYLPAPVVKYMLKLYADKTLLKQGDPVIYANKKARLNSLYGMAGTALVQDNIVEHTEAEILAGAKPYEKNRKTNDEIQRELWDYQIKTYKNVLPYSTGLYCTSWQRFMLMDMALKAGIDLLCYTDTDSLKGRYPESVKQIFEKENNDIIKWTEKRCFDQKIEYELTCPKDTKGNPQYLGTWEHDGSYYQFKCLGAKRYAYRNSPDDCVHITVAGVPKKAGRAIKNLKQFKEGLKIDLFNSHKNIITYLDGNNPLVTFPDGYTVTNKFAANIRPTSYTMTLTEDFRELIQRYLLMKYH